MIRYHFGLFSFTGGAVNVENKIVAYFKPDSALHDSSEYECRITGMVKDNQGHSLEYDRSWSFETGNH
jgi:hypothetical protein